MSERTERWALHRIAATLGAQEEWSDPAGLLEIIASEIVLAGLPDPGSPRSLAHYRNLADTLGIEHDGEEIDHE